MSNDSPPPKIPATGVAPGSLEDHLGRLLRALTLTAAAITLIGVTLTLIAHRGETVDFKTFSGVAPELTSARGVIATAAHSGGSSRAAALAQAGVILLVLTPVLRVAFTMLSFVRWRDWLYAGASAVVLAVLLYGLSGGRS